MYVAMYKYLGLASRLCDGDPVAWQAPNVESCSTVEIIRIKEEVDTIIAAVQNPNSTIVVKPDNVETITSELASATDIIERAIFPNDLRSTIDTIEAILKYVCIFVMQIFVTKTPQMKRVEPDAMAGIKSCEI